MPSRLFFAPQRVRAHIRKPLPKLLPLVAGMLVAGAVFAQSAAVPIDIAAQPLDKALGLLARQTGAQIVFSTALTEKKSASALKGEFTAQQALERLLSDSGLILKREGDLTFTVVPREGASNEVMLRAVSVQADTEEDALGPIKGYRAKRSMTGTKTDTALKDIPQTVNVITRDEIRDRGVTKMTDIFYTVPGAQSSTGYGGLGNGYGVYLRGFSSSGDYRDGFRDFGFVSARDIAFFERVEVLKGPSSVLYGTNDPGGVVNYVTKRPQFRSNYEIKGLVGSFDTRRAEVDVGSTLGTDNQMAFRVVAVYDDRDSHRDYVSSKTTGIAPSLTWQINDTTQLTVLAEFLRYDYTFERGLPTQDIFFDLPRDRFLEEPGINDAESESDRYTVELTHDFNTEWSVRSALSYLKPTIEKTNFYPDGLLADGRTLNRSLDYSEEYQKDRALQIELTGRFTTGAIEHVLLSGIEHYRNNFHYTFAPFDLFAPIDIYQPVYGQVVVPPGFLDQIAFGNDYGSRTSAIYVQDQLTLNPQWKMTLGVRYDHARLFNDDLVDPSISMDEQTQSRASPRAGVVYEPTVDTALFFGYSTSFKPQIFSLKASGALPKPEIGRQLEVGWREEWLEDHLTSTFSVFEIHKENVTTSDPANPAFSIQVGEQRSRGAELEVRGQLGGGFDVIVAGAYTDAAVTHDNTLPEGDRIDSVPRLSSSVWVKYQPNVSGWFAGAGVFYTGDREGNLPNDGVEYPTETRVDALLGFALEHWRAQLNLHNITNEDIFIPYGGLFIPGPGRNADLSLTLNF